MGYITGAAFSVGVGAGLASFQASVGQNSLAAQALQSVQYAADTLFKAGKFPNINLLATVQWMAGNIHDNLEVLRGRWESDIRIHSNNAANAYRLGLVIAIAEGQTTSPNWQSAVDIAHDSLNSASNIVSQNFSMVKLDRSLLNNALQQTQNFGHNAHDAHSAVQNLRIKYNDALTRASEVE